MYPCLRAARLPPPTSMFAVTCWRTELSANPRRDCGVEMRASVAAQRVLYLGSAAFRRAWFENMSHLLISFALAACAVVLFLLLQRSLNRASGRTRSGRHTVRRWISDLLFSAIIGALGALLLDFLASRLVSEYWWPDLDQWGVAGSGALGAMLYQCQSMLRVARRDK